MAGYGQHAGAGYAQGPNYRWWIPAEGISRTVITAEIQRFLGPDALVKPGPGKEENEVGRPVIMDFGRITDWPKGLNGYWISAYRNLTSVCSVVSNPK
jgi:hypothetical protein